MLKKTSFSTSAASVIAKALGLRIGSFSVERRHPEKDAFKIEMTSGVLRREPELYHRTA
jgi:hypothetical protein